MKTNRIISILAAAALTISVSAQQSEHDNYVGVSFGGGLNTMLYSPANGQQSVGGGIDAGLFYGHFFNRTVGLGVGLQYTWSNAYALYNYTETTNGLVHPSNPNQLYNLHTTFTDWREQQTVGYLSIPVEVLFRKAFNDRLGLIGGVGLSVDFPVHGAYSPKGGTYATTGVFPALGNYTVRDLPEHGFSTYDNIQAGKMNNLAKVGASVIGDLGVRYALNNNWGIYCGVYIGYGFTNLIGEAKDEPLVVINSAEQIEYHGTFGSNETAKANLLRFGLKLAIDFGFPAKVNEAPAEEIPTVNEDSLRAAREREERTARFEQYKKEQQEACDAMAKPDDSEACLALIAKAQQEIAELTYDHNLSEADNKARVDAIRDRLAKELEAQREKERLAREAENQRKWEELKSRVEGINVYFNSGSEEPAISDKDKAAIEELCAFLNENKDYKVVVVGHTDNTGSEKKNLEYYGIKRAEVLKKYMEDKGVDASQIRCESKGQTEPVADNATSAGRALNRRANIRFE